MLFASKEIENRIVEELQRGPLDTASLLRGLNAGRAKSTKQGMYAALRKLIRTEVVLKHKQRISLNVAWLSKLNTFTSLAEHFYQRAERSGSFLGLDEGERITYEFKDLSAADAFWNHALYLLIGTLREPVFLSYAPHCWFFLGRQNTERALRDFIVDKGGSYLVSVGAKSPLDKAIAKEFDGERSQYAMLERALFKNNYYVNVIGDYVIEVTMDEGQSNAIHALYESAQALDMHVEERLHDIIRAPGRTRFAISKNKKKAAKLRTKLERPFDLRREAKIRRRAGGAARSSRGAKGR